MYTGGGRKKLENDTRLQEAMKTFAAAYCLYLLKKPKSKEDVRRKAAERVGISHHTALTWLAHPIVRQEIARLVREAEYEAGLTPQRVLRELAIIASSTIGDYFDPDGVDGIKLKPIHELSYAGAAVRKIKHTRKTITTGVGENAKTVVENYYEYELWDKMRALELLAQFHKLIKGGDQGLEGPRVILQIPINGAESAVAIDQSRQVAAEYEEIETVSLPDKPV